MNPLIPMMRRLAEAWMGFWFGVPAPNTVLALLRVGTGSMLIYVLFLRSFDLDGLFASAASISVIAASEAEEPAKSSLSGESGRLYAGASATCVLRPEGGGRCVGRSTELINRSEDPKLGDLSGVRTIALGWGRPDLDDASPAHRLRRIRVGALCDIRGFPGGRPSIVAVRPNAIRPLHRWVRLLHLPTCSQSKLCAPGV